MVPTVQVRTLGYGQGYIASGWQSHDGTQTLNVLIVLHPSPTCLREQEGEPKDVSWIPITNRNC